MRKKIALVEDKDLEAKLMKLTEELNDSVAQIYDQAIRDSKTGLYNNYFFQTILEMELDKARRDEQDLSLYMMDIDFFKKLNDTYGHLVGDKLLAQLASVIKGQIRKSDVAARFGGEEFTILFPESSLNQAKRLTIRLNEAIKEDPLLREYNLTTSGGLTHYREGDSSESIIERVDRGLYQAKDEGRDRFIIIK